MSRCGGLDFLSGFWRIHFSTQQHVLVWTEETLVNTANSIINFYNTHGFNEFTYIADNKVKCLHPLLAKGVNSNTATNNKQAADIEKHIHMIKECFHAIVSRLPYKCIPACIIMEIFSFCILWLNIFPPKNGIFELLSVHHIHWNHSGCAKTFQNLIWCICKSSQWSWPDQQWHTLHCPCHLFGAQQ